MTSKKSKDSKEVPKSELDLAAEALLTNDKAYKPNAIVDFPYYRAFMKHILL